jgi:LemA protein
VRSAHRGEAVLFVLAIALPCAGGAGAAALLLHAADLRGAALALLGGLPFLLPVWWLLTHNRLIRLRQQVRTACRQIDVDLGVRAELVPKLAEVVRGATAHERDLLESLGRIRSGGDLDDRVAAESQHRAAARTVLVLHERYPELKTDALYRDLHERLWAIEEKLAHSRTFYNDVVTEWNDRIARFPALLVARACAHRAAALFAGGDDDLPPRLP